ncbi:DEAD/DEAH box helicase family protein [Haliscomenobacter sp.]|uniref:DEAD/DEAH box helicase family protein n=1 Tax=Haliscomenobacter sp. TaxID=2717303 RepID=UPI0033650500
MKQCTIVIRDEVNIKIEGLDLDCRKALVTAFKYENPAARYLPAVRLGRWDGKIAYFQLGGSTYVNLLPEIMPILDKFDYSPVLDDQREYTTTFDFAAVSENHYNHVLWPKSHPAAGQPMVLRDYQVEIINKFLTNPQCIQEVATGAGKTIITAALSDAVSAYGRSIVIVPNKSLVTQTEADYINMGLDVGVYFGDRKEYNRQHTICTWQSLNNMMKLTKTGEAEITIHEFIQDVVCVIVDEVHMAKADALKTLLTGAMSQIPLRWGLTGTVPKELFESQALLVSLGPVVSRLSASTLQDAGVLAQCHVNIVQLVDHVEYKDYQSELKYLLEESGRLDTMAELIRKVNETGNTLVLVDRTECGRQLVERLGDKAVFVSGSTKAKTRQDEYNQVADATDKIIVATYGVAAVGINIPRIFNLVLVEPGKSFVRVIQSIGRGIRKAEDKDHVEIWDITSTCKFAKRHLTKRKAFYKEANYPFSAEKLEWMKIK